MMKKKEKKKLMQQRRVKQIVVQNQIYYKYILRRGGTVEYVMRSAKKRDPREYIYGGVIQSSRYNHHKKKDYDNYMCSGSAVYMKGHSLIKKEKKKSLDESIYGEKST
jgi:hypothetical protein